MFTGITQDAMWLLAQNRFENSKAFYEEHKPRIQQEVVQPLRELLAELGDTAQEIDPKILIDPNRNGAVSRVRRDNRYTHDKSLYRENMWIALMRDKKAYECAPGFFMDFSLNGSTYGLGFRWCPPGLMQALRAEIDGELRKAAADVDMDAVNACEALLAETGAGDVDMVIGRAALEKPSAAMQRFETVAAQLACHRVYTGKEYLIGCLSGGALRVEAWRSLYRRAFLQQNDLHFQKGIMHEDEEFTPRALLAAQKVVLSDRAFYHYDNARTGSIMNNSAASLRKLTHRVQIYNQQWELYRTVQPRRLRRLLEDDLSWKYLDCVCRYDPAKRDELAVGRTVPLRCAYKPKRKLKALAYAICPTLYTNRFGKN